MKIPISKQSKKLIRHSGIPYPSSKPSSNPLSIISDFFSSVFNRKLPPVIRTIRNHDEDPPITIQSYATSEVPQITSKDPQITIEEPPITIQSDATSEVPQITSEDPPITFEDNATGENYKLVTRIGEFILAIDNNSTDYFLTDIPTIMSRVNIRDMAFIMEKEINTKTSEETGQVLIKILKSRSDEDNLKLIEHSSLLEYKKRIIQNFLLESQIMNIELTYPCIGYSDVPHSFGDTTTHAYHKDNMVSIVTSGTFKDELDSIISSNGRLVDLSFFRYKSVCVSTTIRILYNGERIEIRTLVRPETTIAINNKLIEHSKPFIIEQDEGKTYKADRRQLNEQVLLDSRKERSLNRIEVKFLTFHQLQRIYSSRPPSQLF